jgi:hypothetical protein
MALPNRRTQLRQAPRRPLARTATETGIQRRPVPRLPDDLVRKVEQDPSFQVMTVDGMHWIEPFTAQLVPAGIGRAAAAREWLIAHPEVWRDRQVMDPGALEVVRIHHDLQRRIDPGGPFYDQRFCLFAPEDLGLGWLNPCTGEFVPAVQRHEGRIVPRTLHEMARILATSMDFRQGRLLDLNTLRTRGQAIVAQVRGSRVAASAPPVAPAAPVAAAAAPGIDLDRAKAVQQQLLPDLPVLDRYDIGVHFAPHSGISGDFYEVLPLRDGRILLAVGDVSGHGVQAALVVASALKTLRLLGRSAQDLPALLAQFNDEIKPDLPPGEFLTLCAAMLDPASGRCEVVRAGHHPALLANPSKATVLRRCGGSGMGIGLVTGQAFARTLKPEWLTMDPGDVLVFTTDGLAEAEDADQEQFGEHRLCGHLLMNLDRNSQEICDALATAASAHAGGQPADDLTVLAIAALEAEG